MISPEPETKKVSLDSGALSPQIVTEIDLLVSPGSNESVLPAVR